MIYARPARAILLTILWKLMEGSVPRVLVPHTPDIVEAVTGEQSVPMLPPCTSKGRASIAQVGKESLRNQ